MGDRLVLVQSVMDVVGRPGRGEVGGVNKRRDILRGYGWSEADDFCLEELDRPWTANTGIGQG